MPEFGLLPRTAAGAGMLSDRYRGTVTFSAQQLRELTKILQAGCRWMLAYRSRGWAVMVDRSGWCPPHGVGGIAVDPTMQGNVSTLWLQRPWQETGRRVRGAARRRAILPSAVSWEQAT